MRVLRGPLQIDERCFRKLSLPPFVMVLYTYRLSRQWFLAVQIILFVAFMALSMPGMHFDLQFGRAATPEARTSANAWLEAVKVGFAVFVSLLAVGYRYAVRVSS